MSLDRFKEAQASAQSGHAIALAELHAGRKTSHWIWYIFPQLAELGRSPTARFYGICDLAEARDYLSDPLLRDRLLAVTAAVAEQIESGVRIPDLMGGAVDSAKLVSCLTLFTLAAPSLDSVQPDPTLLRFIVLSEKILTAAAREGFAVCELTRKSASPPT